VVITPKRQAPPPSMSRARIAIIIAIVITLVVGMFLLIRPM
jgi:hypothetical protein